ncbi:MAG: hypothetical protein PHU27_00335 [Salinivirgaceae bacterium]|nr:hypothetical protein [Salinivirgaceae bacterium]MDY0281791.1 hypothetical protein [Salinivirgaceae bacterium]
MVKREQATFLFDEILGYVSSLPDLSGRVNMTFALQNKRKGRISLVTTDCYPE